MGSWRDRGDSGNAIVEFIAFGLLIFAPLAMFSAQVTVDWITKEELVGAASQLARAYSVDQSVYAELVDRYRSSQPGLDVAVSTTNCCVEVVARRNGVSAHARQVL